MFNQINIKSKELDKYSIYFTFDFDTESSNLLTSFIKENKYESVFILVDSNVCQKHLPSLLKILKNESIKFDYFSLVSLEAIKNLESCQLVYKKMLALNLSRKTLFINFGGGIISDLGGFVASTYKRGVDFINIPTSLLAMVDASIGGKVGVDLAENKNSIGLFINPKLLLVNLSLLETLPKRELFNGWAEVIKHGLIHDKDFFNLATQTSPDLLSEQELIQIIKKSCEIKYFYVKDDEHDSGKRQLLNFGHTVGHALESYFLKSANPLKHGEAVLWGMLIESYVSNLMGILSDEEYFLIKKEFEKFGLIKIDFNNLSLDKIKPFLLNDKKNHNNKIIFNLIKKIGEVEYGQILDLSKLDEAISTFKN